jgi:hypothetical protein
MRVKDVVILKEVADDMNDGKAFMIKENPVLVITFGTVYWPISNH